MSEAKPVKKVAKKVAHKNQTALQKTAVVTEQGIARLAERIEQLNSTVKEESEAAAKAAEQSRAVAERAGEAATAAEKSAAASESSAASSKRANLLMWIALGGVAGVLLIVIVIASFAWANDTRDDAALQRAIDRIEAESLARQADTLDRRIEACERDNDVRAGLRLKASTTAAGFTSFADQLTENAEKTPELLAARARFDASVVEPQLKLASDKDGPFASRDCRPEVLDDDPVNG